MTVTGNERLTAYTGLVLLVMLAIEGATILAIRSLLVPHVLIGLAVVPPFALKLASVLHRFIRYHTGDAAFRAAGPPSLGMRLLGPVVVVLSIAVLATGIELWLFGDGFGAEWRALHKLSFVAWFLAMTVHVLVYTGRAGWTVLEDVRSRSAGALTWRGLAVGSVVLGIVVAAAMASYHSPFVVLPER